MGQKVSLPKPELGKSWLGESALATGKSKSHAVTNLFFLRDPGADLLFPPRKQCLLLVSVSFC